MAYRFYVDLPDSYGPEEPVFPLLRRVRRRDASFLSSRNGDTLEGMPVVTNNTGTTLLGIAPPQVL